MSADGERNFVSEQLNWSMRCESELESAKQWAQNWGACFSRITTVPQQIKALEEQIKELPGATLNTNYQLGYPKPTPFKEYAVGPCVKKSIKEEDVRRLAQQLAVTNGTGSKK
ncbi:hypothetical protein JKP88DRAFT_285960 [Tribonema minus]|uniref:Uncharacterized protein n=1 Tax=Tribonema minus TaxID=303371 RepID=A0A836CLA7_9STRA|nr:hypothetical protein JKP88DRAFT_285960 [Tribonema minus]